MSAESTAEGTFAAAHGYTAELEPRPLSTTDAVRSGVGGWLESFKAEGVTVHHCDCMELMRATPDGAFDLAIVDPPYRDENAPTEWMKNYGSMRTIAGRPSPEYWRELRRVSREQIVWGANNFGLEFKGFVAWDKRIRGSDRYSWVEVASLSEGLGTVSSLVDVGVEGDRLHPTQKPVKLYAWLLAKYAKPGQRVLDTHFGSGSIAIAARNFGCELVACEIDADYFTAATARIARDFSQQMLFSGGGAEPVGEQLDAFEHSGAQRYNHPLPDSPGLAPSGEAQP